MELIPETDPDEDDATWGLAINESSKSLMRFKLGAVIVKRGKVIAFGHNKAKTHPRYGSKSGFHTLHAEGDSLWTAEKLEVDVKGATMIVYRKNALNARPCKDCQRLIREAGIKRVIYTNHEQGCIRQTQGE